MNWANNTEVSAYFKALISKYKKVTITYIGETIERNITTIINNDVSKWPIFIFEDLRGTADGTEDTALCENIQVAFFILYSLEIGDDAVINATLDKTSAIGKDFVTRIGKDIEDDVYFTLKKAAFEPVFQLEPNLYGHLITIDFRGNLLQFDSEAWTDGDTL